MSINENFVHVTEISRDAGFSKRGAAFFRVCGSDVLQVLLYTKNESPFHSEVISVGLFSLYSELLPQWLTARGCIPSYNSRYISAPRWELEHAYKEASVKSLSLLEDVLVFHFHLDDFVNCTIPFLNTINTQKKMLEGIDFLEYVSCSQKPENPKDALRWTDMNKYAPYLFERQYDQAERIAQTLLDLWHVDQLDQDLSDLDPRAEALRQKILLARGGNPQEIQTFLVKNFQRNLELTAFCRRQSIKQ